MGFFDKLKQGLNKTKESINEKINDVFSNFRKVDEDFLEELEEALIMSDIGIETSTKIISNLRERIKKEKFASLMPKGFKVMFAGNIGAAQDFESIIKAANEVGSDNYSLYGQESNGSTWALCKMNMFLHSKDNARIEWGDTLNNPKLIEGDTTMKFDVVVANPPFSLDKWGAENANSDRFHRFWRGVPPKNRGDYAFISHMIETAVADGGKVGVVVPHGVLFREGAEGKIRKEFIEKDNCLDAVIGLPQNLFYGTGIPAAILVFKKNRKNEDILFIDASREYESGKNQNILRDSDIEKIVQIYKKRETIEKYSYLATLDEIKENEYNLNIPRYVDTFEEEAEIDIQATQKEIENLEKQLADVQTKMKGYLKELGING